MPRRIHLPMVENSPEWQRVRQAFPEVELYFGSAPAAVPMLDALWWDAPAFDPRWFEERFGDATTGGVEVLEVEGASPRVVLQILTLSQGAGDRRNGASRTAAFDRLLEIHRRLHDCSLPLVRADYNHARDVWQWVLRLQPQAGAAVQAAALFHDVERLRSEATRRVEHLAPDYQAFKDAHAEGGVAQTARCLEGAGFSPDFAREACRLVKQHERPGSDPDLVVLNDADALSFFSLNSAGFVDYFGPDHARMKVRWTLRRLSRRGLVHLATIRLRADVRRLLEAASAELEAEWLRSAEEA